MRLEPELRWTETLPTEPNPYAVGSIWRTSWGYDQTNVDYYTVVRETAASVWLVPMTSEYRDGREFPGSPVLWTTGDLCETCKGNGYVWVRDDDGWSSQRETCADCNGVAIVQPEMHRKPRAEYAREHPYLRMDDVRHAWPYNGGGSYSTAASGQPGH